MSDASLGLPGPIWCERALIFNFQPARYLHPSWPRALRYGDVAHRLREVPQALSMLSHYLLQALDLEGRYVEDFANPWARLALLDGALLEHLLRRIGLALCAPLMRSELSGSAVRQLKRSLGEDDWTFVMRETPLLGRLEYPEGDVAWRTAAEPRAHFGLIGARFCVRHGFSAQDVALTRRLALKLPVNWRAVWESKQTPHSLDFPPLLRKLLRDLPPTWLPLFD